METIWELWTILLKRIYMNYQYPIEKNATEWSIETIFIEIPNMSKASITRVTVGYIINGVP